MTLMKVILHEHLEFFSEIEDEFHETPIFQALLRNGYQHDQKYYLLYFRRWLHTKAHEYGKHVHYQQSTGAWGHLCSPITTSTLHSS
jgi:hypothetical protein